MRNTSLPYALLVGLAVSVACEEDVGQDPFFNPTATDSNTATDTTMGSQTTDPTIGDDTTTSDSSVPTTSITESAGTTTADESSSGTTEDTNGGQMCGDGVISGSEQCDCGGGLCTAEGLGNTQCEDVDDPLAPGVLTGGDLGCNPASCKFDISQCTYCGDRLVNGNEGCEPTLPIDTTCEEQGAGTLGDLACDESCQLDTSMCTDCGYNFDFVPCPGDWMVGNAGGAAAPTWDCGDPNDYGAGPGVGETGVWATNLAGPYLDEESSFVSTPDLDLTNCAGRTLTMTLRHWFNFQGGVVNGDGGVVQVSTNGGNNWTTIAPTAGTMYGANPIEAVSGPVNGNVGFDGQSVDEQMWVESEFDLTEYAGDSGLRIRFVMGSNDITPQGGWYLDNLSIIGSG